MAPSRRPAPRARQSRPSAGRALLAVPGAGRHIGALLTMPVCCPPCLALLPCARRPSTHGPAPPLRRCRSALPCAEAGDGCPSRTDSACVSANERAFSVGEFVRAGAASAEASQFRLPGKRHPREGGPWAGSRRCALTEPLPLPTAPAALRAWGPGGRGPAEPAVGWCPVDGPGVLTSVRVTPAVKLFSPSGTVGVSRKGLVRRARRAMTGPPRRAVGAPLAHSFRDTPTTRAVQWVNPLPSATRRAHGVPRMRRSPVVRGRNPADGDHVATAIR